MKIYDLSVSIRVHLFSIIIIFFKRKTGVIIQLLHDRSGDLYFQFKENVLLTKIRLISSMHELPLWFVTIWTFISF